MAMFVPFIPLALEVVGYTVGAIGGITLYNKLRGLSE